MRIDTPRPTKHPTMPDIYWAAGFLDGEGYFGMCSSGNGHRISASQRDRELLDRLASLFGGSVNPRRFSNKAFEGTKYASLNGKLLHVWEVTGAQARGLMMTLYLLLSARRKEQVRKVLEPLCVRRT